MEKSVTKMGTAPFFDVAPALESYRSSGFDLATAVGEVIDNSIQAGATIIRVNVERDGKAIAGVAIADNGTGIDASILPRVLSLGFSSRYNERNGMGRFGVGMKLAALSQGRRVDVWTRHASSYGIMHSYLDLDEVGCGSQTSLSADFLERLPNNFSRLFKDPDKEDIEFVTGTIVAWKQDHKLQDGQYRSSADEEVKKTLDFVSRAYRRFINGGVRIYLDDKYVALHDPMFLLPNPRLDAVKVDDERYRPIAGTMISDESFTIEDSQKIQREVRIVVSIAPIVFRFKEGGGGRYRSDVTRIGPDIQGSVSLMRQGREIYYDIIPRSFPKGSTDIDRFIGVEISFPASLDDLFRVRNVKRGAEPDKNLRDEIRRRLEQPIKAARRMIRDTFAQTASESPPSDHRPVAEAVNRNASEQQRGQAGQTRPEDVPNKVIEALAGDDSAVLPSEARVADIVETIKDGGVEITYGSWPGREMFEITHINGAILIKLNQQHAVLTAYRQLSDVSFREDEELSPSRAAELLSLARDTINALILGYAKAESFEREADTKYRDLRTFWGLWSWNRFDELRKEADRRRG